jgi:hypothetical protein
MGAVARRTWRVRRACGIAIVAALIAVINPAVGYAAAKPSVKLSSLTATCSLTYPAICSPSAGNDIVAKVNLGQNFTRSGLKLTMVCLDFTFDPDDPLSVGEEIFVEGYGGALNIGTEDQLFRQLCFLDYGMNLLEEFQDGKATLHIDARIGSFKLAGVTVSYATQPLS